MIAYFYLVDKREIGLVERELVEAICAGEGAVLVESLEVFFGEVGATEAVGDGGGEVEARVVVEGEHFHGGSGGANFFEAVDFEAVLVGVAGEDGAEGIGVAVEAGEDGEVSGEVIVEGGLGERVGGGADGAVSERVEADEAEAGFWAVVFDNFAGAEHFASGEVTGSGEDEFGVVVGGKAVDAGAAVVKEELGVVRVDPTRVVVFVERCKIYNVFGGEHEVEGGDGSGVVDWEEAVDFATGEVEEGGDDGGRLVREAVVVLAPAHGGGEEVDGRPRFAPSDGVHLFVEFDL